jgi:hypothetical protein
MLKLFRQHRTLVLSTECDGQAYQCRADGDHGEAGDNAVHPGIASQHIAGAEEQRDGDGVRDVQRQGLWMNRNGTTTGRVERTTRKKTASEPSQFSQVSPKLLAGCGSRFRCVWIRSKSADCSASAIFDGARRQSSPAPVADRCIAVHGAGA